MPKVEQAAPSPVGPFLPPGGVESPVTDGSSGTGYWLPLLAVVGDRLARRGAFRATARGDGHARRRQARHRAPRSNDSCGRSRRDDRRVGRREERARGPLGRPSSTHPPPSLRPTRSRSSPEARSSPCPTSRGAPASSVRRYVVVTDDAGRPLRRSKAFWRIGGAAAQQRRAEAAWDDLANGLRADGWELDTAGRYEYYVPLRRAIVATLEPYTQARPADSDEA